jgi:CTLH/CRA C-terminal to LisH motif domain
MQAVQEAEKLAAGVLDDDPKVKFEVRLQQFLEMLRSEPSTDQQLEAMQFARTTLNPCAKDCSSTEQDAMLSVRVTPLHGSLQAVANMGDVCVDGLGVESATCALVQF